MAQNSAGVIDAYLIQIFQIGCLGVPSEPGAEIIAAETHNGCCLPQRDFLRKVCLRPVEDLTQLRILGRERFGFETLFRRGLAFELAETGLRYLPALSVLPARPEAHRCSQVPG